MKNIDKHFNKILVAILVSILLLKVAIDLGGTVLNGDLIINASETTDTSITVQYSFYSNSIVEIYDSDNNLIEQHYEAYTAVDKVQNEQYTFTNLESNTEYKIILSSEIDCDMLAVDEEVSTTLKTEITEPEVVDPEVVESQPAVNNLTANNTNDNQTTVNNTNDYQTPNEDEIVVEDDGNSNYYFNQNITIN